MTDVKTTDESELEYSKKKRKEIIEGIFSSGVPKDTKDQSIVLQALDGLDRITLTKMRIKSDEGVSTSQAAAASLLVHLLNSKGIKTIGKTEEPVGEIPVLDETLPTVEIVPGELDSSVVKDNYSNFLKRNNLE